jgi:hypothetical protein
LLTDDHDQLVAASEHSVRCTARAARCLSVALHLDLAAVAT